MSKAAPKVIHASGKRKRAIARATLSSGSGKLSVNNTSISTWGNVLSRARITEPVVLAGELGKKYDIAVRASGGGITGQADAIRLAIGRAFAQIDERLRSHFIDYDRQLIVADVRRKESAKPNSHGQARSKTQKSYR